MGHLGFLATGRGKPSRGFTSAKAGPLIAAYNAPNHAASESRPPPCRPLDFDHDTLDHLRRHHPAWRLLRSDHAALIASFLHRAFIAPNERVLAQSDIERARSGDLPLLDDTALRDRFQQFMQTARDLLTDFRETILAASAATLRPARRHLNK